MTSAKRFRSPMWAWPDGIRPDGLRPDGLRPDGIRPDGIRPDGIRPDGIRPDGIRPDETGPAASRSGSPRPDAARPRADGLIDGRPGIFWMWRGSWRRFLFPSVFLIYVVQTAAGALDNPSPVWAGVGLLILLAFCACYLRCMSNGSGGRYDRFWVSYWAMVVLFVLECPIAHADAFVMLTYVAVMTVAALFERAIPVLVLLVLATLFVPPLIPSWHQGVQIGSALAIGIVSLAMFGFFGLIRANIALDSARTEVARLAAENERTRIARDLHDLLGHSLTTVTVKAGLARRLAATDPERAAREIGEVEELARRSLADVRAAVAGYREMTLAGELATVREVLRSAGIEARLPNALDEVDPRWSETFGWVLREGVTNVVRHSRATRCTVTVGRDWIEIVDDGVGGEDPAPGSGLRGLRERVEAAAGTVVSGPLRPGPGWRLRVRIGVPDPATQARAGVAQRD